MDFWFKNQVSICFDILRIYPIIFFSAFFVLETLPPIYSPDRYNQQWSIMSAQWQWNANNLSQDYTKNSNDDTITNRNMNRNVVKL